MSKNLTMYTKIEVRTDDEITDDQNKQLVKHIEAYGPILSPQQGNCISIEREVGNTILVHYIVENRIYGIDGRLIFKLMKVGEVVRVKKVIEKK